MPRCHQHQQVPFPTTEKWLAIMHRMLVLLIAIVTAIPYAGGTEREPLINITELSAWLGVPEWTIRGWRHRGEGPPAVKVGAHHLRWRPEDVEAWLRERTATSV